MPKRGGFEGPKRFVFAVLALGCLAATPALAQVNEYALPPVSQLVRLAPGATLQGALADAGVASADIKAAIDALNAVFPPRGLRAGQEIVVDFAGALRELRFSAGVEHDIVVTRSGAHSFAAQARPRALTRVPELAVGVVSTNLFEAATEAGVPMSVLSEMIRAFSYDVDFQRDLRPDDRFEVLFERLYDERGKAVGAGDVVYAAMTLAGKTQRLYRYLPAGARNAEFYTERGQSAKKALLRTPVDGARLSSGFGMRLHPILGYTKMHRGIDFAVPPGTPIMAASDGVVERAGPSGAYGNFVLLHHAGIVETAYAHMSRIAGGIRPGAHVRQGEVIGFVGATGRATGPHLHYEVRIKGAPVNPLSVKSQPGQPLIGRDLVAFGAAADLVDRQVVRLRATTQVAEVPMRRTQQ